MPDNEELPDTTKYDFEQPLWLIEIDYGGDRITQHVVNGPDARTAWRNALDKAVSEGEDLLKAVTFTVAAMEDLEK